MYKSIILIITLSAITLTYFLSSFIPLENIDSENIRIQFYFVYGSEALFGLLLSGVLCTNKNEFEPYHLAQIFLGFIYIIIEFCCISLIFLHTTKNLLLAINVITTFFTASLLLLTMLANFKSRNFINLKSQTKGIEK